MYTIQYHHVYSSEQNVQHLIMIWLQGNFELWQSARSVLLRISKHIEYCTPKVNNWLYWLLSDLTRSAAVTNSVISEVEEPSSSLGYSLTTSDHWWQLGQTVRLTLLFRRCTNIKDLISFMNDDQDFWTVPIPVLYDRSVAGRLWGMPQSLPLP